MSTKNYGVKEQLPRRRRRVSVKKSSESRVSGEDVKAFWKYMSNKYNFDIVTKGNAAEMKIIAWALDQMDIQNQSDFLKKYTTTVCLGGWRAVYVPFEIGKGTQAQLIHQISVAVHESQHIVQADRDPTQPLKYLASDTSRAYYEADGYRATMEMYWFLTGRLLSPRTLANKLRGYSVGAADRRIAEKHLVIAAKVVKRGGVITGTSKVAIRWWKRKIVTNRIVTSIKL